MACCKFNVRAGAVALLFAACTSDDSDLAEADAGLDAATPDASGSADASPGVDARLEASTAPLDAARDAEASGNFAEVRLQFAARVGREAFVCGNRYQVEEFSNLDLQPIDLRFFVERVRLITRSGQEVPLELAERLPHQTSEVALLDFTQGGGTCPSGSVAANSMITGRAPPGDYVGVAFSTAVPQSLNHGNPSTAPAPLKTPGAHWTWLSGYRFFMARVHTSVRDGGVGEATDAGGSGGHGPLASGDSQLHVGAQACVGGVGAGFSCNRPNRNDIRLMNFEPGQSRIVVDFARAFRGFDLTRSVACHGSEGPCASGYRALGIDPQTGAALSTNEVFSVE